MSGPGELEHHDGVLFIRGEDMPEGCDCVNGVIEGSDDGEFWVVYDQDYATENWSAEAIRKNPGLAGKRRCDS